MLAGLLSANSTETVPGQQNAGILDMALLSSAVENILKFDTEKEAFNTNYPKTDHLQRFFNEKAIDHFAQVVTNKYNIKKEPISILDFCCGYGLFTLSLRDKLIKNGVQMSKIFGYDVSEDIIIFALKNNTFYTQLVFHKKNVEKEFDGVNQYDVVICLFGLHQMNDLDHTIEKVHRSLKSGELLLSLTLIEIPDIFDFRTAFVNKSNWTVAIAEQARTLHPFHFEKTGYLNHLSKYFKTVYEKKKQTKFTYTHNEQKTFMHSWLQEVRHLTNDVPHEIKKEAVANSYIEDFIDSIPKGLNGNVQINEDGTVIVYTQHTFDYDGEKIDL